MVRPNRLFMSEGYRDFVPFPAKNHQEPAFPWGRIIGRQSASLSPMNISSKLPLTAAAVMVALLSPLAAQEDWVAWSQVNGTATSDQFSYAIESVGDWNQDGYDDYAISAPGSDALYQNGGSITIHSGEDDSVLLTIDALGAGEQLGYCLENLGTHNGDGLPKLAIGAPFATTANGPFSGFVRVYAWDNSTATLGLVDEILGLAPGAMFGSALAGYDRDGDGDLDLAVGAIGTNLMDGQVLAFTLSSAGVSLPAVATYDGNPGSGEMFGWAITRADLSGVGAPPPPGANAEGLAIGVPFADDLASEAGAVILIDSAGTQTQLTNPVGSLADAHLGYSIFGGEDVLGDFTTDLGAGAPDTANGNVFVWDGMDFSEASNLAGDSAGSRYGFSLAMIPDANFDDKFDIAAGAPATNAGRGAFRVNEVDTAANDQLYAADGIAGTTGNFGFSINTLGDINITGKSELGVGAPWIGNNRGRLESFSPPGQDIDPIDLTASGSFDWGTDIALDVINLSEGSGGNLYWYVGTSPTNSTSNEGFSVNISNGGGSAPTLIRQTVSPGSVAQTNYFLDDIFPNNTVLYFQLVEYRNGFIRFSDVDGGQVHERGVSIFVEGNQAPGTVTLTTRWGFVNSPVFFYASAIGQTPGATNNVSNGNWKLNLINPINLGTGSYSSGDTGQPNEGEATTGPLNVPAAASGLTIYFQAYDWAIFNGDLTDVVAVDFQ